MGVVMTDSGSIPTMTEDVAEMIDRRDGDRPTGRHKIDQGELAEAVATLMQDGGGGPKSSRSALVTIIAAVITLAGALGAGNWAVMSSGDADTQAIVREELQTYGDKMEVKIAVERDAVRAEMARDREEVSDKIERIEKTSQQVAVDIAVIKARLEK